MALYKQIEDNVGNTHEYWRLIGFHVNAASKKLALNMVGYKDQAAREAGKQHDPRRDFNWSGDAFNAVAMGSAWDVLQVIFDLQGVDTSGWPQDIIDALSAITFYDFLGTWGYGAIKSVTETVVDPETGEETEVPGEFADATNILNPMDSTEPQ